MNSTAKLKIYNSNTVLFLNNIRITFLNISEFIYFKLRFDSAQVIMSENIFVI